MMRYSLFLLTFSMLFITLLCASAKNCAPSVDETGTYTDYFSENLRILMQGFADVSGSSNEFLKYFRDEIDKYIEFYDKDKKLILVAVNKGTEMEKKIRNISQNLKNSTKPLPAEIQSELEEIGKHAATELTKLKGMESLNEFDEMNEEFKIKYAEIQGKIKELSKVTLSMIKTNTEAKNPKENCPPSDEVKTKIIELIKTAVRVLFAIKKDSDSISNKMETTAHALSKIRKDLIKVEQIQYHLLLAHKDDFQSDAASLIPSSMVQFFFAIMFGMIF